MVRVVVRLVLLPSMWEAVVHSQYTGQVELLLTNASDDRDYVDEEALVWKNASVIVRRVPKAIGKTIGDDEELKEEKKRTAASSNVESDMEGRDKRLETSDWVKKAPNSSPRGAGRGRTILKHLSN